MEKSCFSSTSGREEALESVEDVRKFMQIRFLGQFVRHELISQMEAEEIFQEKEEKVTMLGMK